MYGVVEEREDRRHHHKALSQHISIILGAVLWQRQTIGLQVAGGALVCGSVLECTDACMNDRVIDTLYDLYADVPVEQGVITYYQMY